MSRGQNKERRRGVRLTAAVAALGLVVWVAIGSTAEAAPDVVYDATGTSLPSNVPSLGFEAQQTNEFGDLVTLAAGPRELTNVSVVMSTQACETGGGTTCVTTDGATFDHPLTMTLYNVAGTPAAPTVGSVIATVTDTFTIPFRPSSDPVNCSGPLAGRWYDGTNCFLGLAVIVDFVFPAGTILPDTLIWGIAYNTASSGYAPIGTPGPYDSLNVGAFTIDPTIGTDVDVDMAFVSAGDTGGFVSELGWAANRPMARIEAQVPVVPTSTTAATTPTAPPETATPTSTTASTTTTVAPTTTAAATTTTVAPPTAAPTTVLNPGEELPTTGTDSSKLAGLALAFIVAGTALTFGLSRRRSDAR